MDGGVVWIFRLEEGEPRTFPSPPTPWSPFVPPKYCLQFPWYNLSRKIPFTVFRSNLIEFLFSFYMTEFIGPTPFPSTGGPRTLSRCSWTLGGPGKTENREERFRVKLRGRLTTEGTSYFCTDGRREYSWRRVEVLILPYEKEGKVNHFRICSFGLPGQDTRFSTSWYFLSRVIVVHLLLLLIDGYFLRVFLPTHGSSVVVSTGGLFLEGQDPGVRRRHTTLDGAHSSSPFLCPYSVVPTSTTLGPF